MKTILYQPIFINPQAYFVFPSLYHIEKGDSFIEPANITGQLIINTLTDDPTLTPIKSGNLKALDILAIGAFIDNNFISSFNWKGCHGTVIVADRSFTEEEIDWIKENIYNIKI